MGDRTEDSSGLSGSSETMLSSELATTRPEREEPTIFNYWSGSTLPSYTIFPPTIVSTDSVFGTRARSKHRTQHKAHSSSLFIEIPSSKHSLISWWTSQCWTGIAMEKT
jgi:hypothetical protein